MGQFVMGIDKKFFELVLDHIENEVSVFENIIPENKRTEGDKQGVKRLTDLVGNYRKLIEKNQNNESFFSEVLSSQIKNSIKNIEASIIKDGWFSNRDPQISKSILLKLPEFIEEATGKMSRQSQSQNPQIEQRLKQLEESNKENKDTIKQLEEKSAKAETENQTLKQQVENLQNTAQSLALQRDEAMNFFIDLSKTGISTQQIEEFFGIYKAKVPDNLLEPPKPIYGTSLFSETYPDLDQEYIKSLDVVPAKEKLQNWLAQSTDNPVIYDRYKLKKALPDAVFAAIHELIDVIKQVEDSGHQVYCKALIYRLIDTTLVEQQDYEDLPWKQRLAQVIQDCSNLVPKSQDSALVTALSKIQDFKFSSRLPKETLKNRFGYLAKPAASGYWLPKANDIAKDYGNQQPHYYKSPNALKNI